MLPIGAAAQRLPMLAPRVCTGPARLIAQQSGGHHARRCSAGPSSDSQERYLVTSARNAQKEHADAPPTQGMLSKLLHGNLRSQKEGELAHSLAVGRGRHVHEIVRHTVQPAMVDTYKRVVADAYPRITSSLAEGSSTVISGGEGAESKMPTLLGSWQVHVGGQDTFYHIWRYDSYAAYDASSTFDPARSTPSDPHAPLTGIADLRAQLESLIAPTLRTRSNWLAKEFAFWPTANQVNKASHFEKMHGISPAPADLVEQDWIFELRTYHLKPGSLLEWSSYWRRGLEARVKYVEPVGAWFTQVGGLHTVFHIWAYPSLEERKVTRDAAWQEDAWSGTVQSVRIHNAVQPSLLPCWRCLLCCWRGALSSVLAFSFLAASSQVARS